MTRPQIFAIVFMLCSGWYMGIHFNNGIFFHKMLDFEMFQPAFTKVSMPYFSEQLGFCYVGYFINIKM